MPTLFTVEYSAIDINGDLIERAHLPIAELPDRPSKLYKKVHPIKYRRIMMERATAVYVVMEKLFDLCRQEGYTRLSASFKWSLIDLKEADLIGNDTERI